MQNASTKTAYFPATPERECLLRLKDIWETGGDGQYTNELNMVNAALAKGEIKLIEREPKLQDTIPV